MVTRMPTMTESSAAELHFVRPRDSRASLGYKVLVGSSVAVFVFSQIEGYLILLHPQLAKLPAVLLFGAWVLFRFRLDPKPRMHVLYVLLAALAAIVLTSTALHLDNPLVFEYLFRWLPFIAICAVIADVASSIVSIRLLMASAVVGASIAAVGALYSFLMLHEPRATGPLDDPNDLAYVLVAALLLTVAFTPRGISARVALMLAVIVIAVAITTTISRGGLIALTAGLIWVLLRRAVLVKTVLFATAFASVAAAALIEALNGWPLIVKALSEKQYIAETNIDLRLSRWQAAARMLAHDGLFGVGPGGFREHYVVASTLAEISEQTPVAHNMYLEVAAELGVIGLAVFVGLIVLAFVASESALRQGADRKLVIAVQASLVAIVTASITLSEQYYFTLWSTLAMTCAIAIRARNGERNARHSRIARDH
jgi:putative inorganic carbon (hco3(-)) transporter